MLRALTIGPAAGRPGRPRARRADDKPQVRRPTSGVFELRTYYTNPGKLDALQQAVPRPHLPALQEARHRADRLLDPAGREGRQGRASSSTCSPSPAARPPRSPGRPSSDDPEWQKVQAESQKDGKIVKKVESVFLDPTDYSPIK